MLLDELVFDEMRDSQSTRCYLCEESSVTSCTRCGQAVCEEHQQETDDHLSAFVVVMCADCANHYESLA